THLLQASNGQGENAVFVRVVRFTDVNADHLRALIARINESDGPPPGVPTTGLQVLFDEDQGTAVGLQMFNTADDLKVGEAAFDAMDAGEPPGTRVSVDRCEVAVEITV